MNLRKPLRHVYWAAKLRFERYVKMGMVDRLAILWQVLTRDSIFVFGSPDHSNLGDNAQTFCIATLLHEEYPSRKVRFFTDGYIERSNYKIANFVRRVCRRSDLVLLHSGYHMTDLYPRADLLNRSVVKAFPDRKIIALPQTIYYQDDNWASQSLSIYNAHGNFTVMCRDQVSFEYAKAKLTKCKLLLMPDIVTTLIGRYDFSDENRHGILFCKRRDKESALNGEEQDGLIRQLEKIDTVDVVDTTVSDNWKTINVNLQGYLENVWRSYAHYRVVITDRYHGTIFGLIACTPVLVLPSTDHKLSSGVDWFGDEFKKYIKFMSNINEVEAAVRVIYATKYSHRLPQFFREKYYLGTLQRILGAS